MKNISEINKDICKKIKYIFTDFDDTLTTNSQFYSSSLEKFEKIKKLGIKLIIVTGRPAGWCDFMARMLPCHAVIGENGALIYYKRNNNMKRIYLGNILVRNDERFTKIKKESLSLHPKIKLAADQYFRMYDLAIDFAEEVNPPLDIQYAQKIKKIFDKYGATSKISSIHVNGWFGDNDKYTACNHFLKNIENLKNNDLSIFIGDSLNDEPLFKKFNHSAAVGNIKKFLSQLQYKPKYITEREGHLGFNTIIDRILLKK